MGWDIVRVRISPQHKDEHPAIVITCDEFCADTGKAQINVLHGSTRRPAKQRRPYQVMLNGADGLDDSTLFSCGHLYSADRRKITKHIGRKIIATYRLPL